MSSERPTHQVPRPSRISSRLKTPLNNKAHPTECHYVEERLEKSITLRRHLGFHPLTPNGLPWVRPTLTGFSRNQFNYTEFLPRGILLLWCSEGTGPRQGDRLV